MLIPFFFFPNLDQHSPVMRKILICKRIQVLYCLCLFDLVCLFSVIDYLFAKIVKQEYREGVKNSNLAFFCVDVFG